MPPLTQAGLLLKAITRSDTQKILQILRRNPDLINKFLPELPGAGGLQTGTPIAYACRIGSIPALGALLAQPNADPNASLSTENLPFGNAFLYARDIQNTNIADTILAKIFEMLLAKGAKLDSFPFADDKTSLLGLLAQEGFVKSAQIIIKAKPDLVNTPNIHGYYPLHSACEFLHVDMVRLLLQNGANPNVHNERFAPPLVLSCHYKVPLTIIEMLVNYGADINLPDKRKNTALMFAVQNKNGARVSKYLIEKGADTSGVNGEGISCVQAAITSETYTQLLLLRDHPKPDESLLCNSPFLSLITDSNYNHPSLFYLFVQELVNQGYCLHPYINRERSAITIHSQQEWKIKILEDNGVKLPVGEKTLERTLYHFQSFGQQNNVELSESTSSNPFSAALTYICNDPNLYELPDNLLLETAIKRAAIVMNQMEDMAGPITKDDIKELFDGKELFILMHAFFKLRKNDTEIVANATLNNYMFLYFVNLLNAIIEYINENNENSQPIKFILEDFFSYAIDALIEEKRLDEALEMIKKYTLNYIYGNTQKTLIHIFTTPTIKPLLTFNKVIDIVLVANNLIKTNNSDTRYFIEKELIIFLYSFISDKKFRPEELKEIAESLITCFEISLKNNITYSNVNLEIALKFFDFIVFKTYAFLASLPEEDLQVSFDYANKAIEIIGRYAGRLNELNSNISDVTETIKQLRVILQSHKETKRSNTQRLNQKTILSIYIPYTNEFPTENRSPLPEIDAEEVRRKNKEDAMKQEAQRREEAHKWLSARLALKKERQDPKSEKPTEPKEKPKPICSEDYIKKAFSAQLNNSPVFPLEYPGLRYGSVWASFTLEANDFDDPNLYSQFKKKFNEHRVRPRAFENTGIVCHKGHYYLRIPTQGLRIHAKVYQIKNGPVLLIFDKNGLVDHDTHIRILNEQAVIRSLPPPPSATLERLAAN